MSRHGSDFRLERTVSFRPPWLASRDGVIADHTGGFLDETPVAPRPGAVPPPAPTRPAPRESLRTRLEQQ